MERPDTRVFEDENSHEFCRKYCKTKIVAQ